MPTNRIHWKLFDYHAKGRREQDVARQKLKGTIRQRKDRRSPKGFHLAVDNDDLRKRLWEKDHSHNNLSPSKDLNPGPRESEAGLSNTGPWVGLTAISELEYVTEHILNCEF
jgi:hypothetical protein